MALTPTLTLWEVEYKGSNPDELKKGMGKAAEQLKAFSRAGGQILFGTDLGYIQRFDTSEEYVWSGHELPANSCFSHHEPSAAIRLLNPSRTHREGHGCRSYRATS